MTGGIPDWTRADILCDINCPRALCQEGAGLANPYPGDCLPTANWRGGLIKGNIFGIAGGMLGMLPQEKHLLYYLVRQLSTEGDSIIMFTVNAKGKK